VLTARLLIISGSAVDVVDVAARWDDLGTGAREFFSLRPHSHLSHEYRGLSPENKAAGREGDDPPSSSAEVNN
jgi:hypothetical protein